MRNLTITETDAGQWIVQTSDGKRSIGATMDSALGKLVHLTRAELVHDFSSLDSIFVGIKSIGTGQIVHGQAGA